MNCKTAISAASCVATLLACVGCSHNHENAAMTGVHDPLYINTRYNEPDRNRTAYNDNTTVRETTRVSDNTRSSDYDHNANRQHQPVATSTLSEWPPNAQAGECYGKAFVPPMVQTVQEQVLVQEASERLEVVPATYEWVEERVMVKDACTQLIEVPTEYKTEQVTMEVTPAQTGWMMDSSGRCVTPDGRPVKDVFCLVNRPAVTKTVSSQRIARAAYTKEVEVPAVYENVRRQKLATPAQCKRTTIPAEFQTVEKSIVTAPGRWEWQRVICDPQKDPITMNRVKDALAAAGYTPSDTDGQMTEHDWDNIKAFQIQHGLGIGGLSYETLAKLHVSVD